MKTIFLASTLFALTIFTSARAQNHDVARLVERFNAARIAHDPNALAETLSPSFEEISPVGDVDAREEVLGFYQPASKRTGPTITNDQVNMIEQENLAIVSMRQSFVTPNGSTRSVRVRYVASRQDAVWRLMSVQYTPIPISQ